MHQLAPHSAVRSRLGRRLSRRRVDRDRRAHAGVLVRARHRSGATGLAGAGDRLPDCGDSDYAVWRAFDNHYWPALYLVDTDSFIRDHHFGEGRYEESKRTMQRLLGIERALVSVEAMGVEAQADWDHLRSPETYLGFDRGERFASPGPVAFDRQATYALPDHLPVHHWALAGSWTIAGESVALGSAGGGIAYRFEARDAHLVLDGSADGTPFRVLLDGERPGPAHGVDVDEEGRGVLREGRLCNLIRVPGEIRERTVQITFEEPGPRAYVFTFG